MPKASIVTVHITRGLRHARRPLLRPDGRVDAQLARWLSGWLVMVYILMMSIPVVMAYVAMACIDRMCI